MPSLTPDTVVTLEQLRNFCLAALDRCGFSDDVARTVADVLVTTNGWHA